MGQILKAISSIIMPKMPKIEMPSMPDPGSMAARLAATKKVAAKRMEGRAGTIYTQGGGGTYAGSNLAGTA